MIVVVADTSPLNYLIQINGDDLLPALYERVFVPSVVVEELHHPRAVASVRTWLTQVPSWLVVEQVAEAADARFARLDPGERQAIQLAQRAHADLLRMDEQLAVRIARNKGSPSRAPREFCYKLPGAAWLTWKSANGPAEHGLPLQPSSDRRSTASGGDVDITRAPGSSEIREMGSAARRLTAPCHQPRRTSHSCG